MFAPILALGLAAGAPSADDFTRAAQANLPEFLELLAIPNVADNPADIRRNADFLKSALEKRGFHAQLLDNPAQRPLVYGELGSGHKGVKTVLYYIHFDGQPVVPSEWAQDPFAPTVKERAGDGWTTVPRERLSACASSPAPPPTTRHRSTCCSAPST